MGKYNGLSEGFKAHFLKIILFTTTIVAFWPQRVKAQPMTKYLYWRGYNSLKSSNKSVVKN